MNSQTIALILLFAVSLLISTTAATADDDSSADSTTQIYIANDDHTDFMWSADEATYEKAFVDMIDFHLALAQATSDKPLPYQNRFNLDGSYWLWVYQKNRSPQDFERVIHAVQSGHLSVPMTALVSCYGGQPTEAVLRGMYYAGKLQRQHGLPFTQAVAMENRTIPLGLASLWAGSGAKYSWRGICKSASRIPLADRDHEIYWWHGPDDQRILMKWYSWRGFYENGGYAEAFNPRQAVERLDTNQDFLTRYRNPGSDQPYRISGAFGFGWDAIDRKPGQPYPADPKGYPVSEHFHDVAESCSNSHRQVFVSNQEDFFQAFEAKYGNDLPSESVTYGNQWDLYSASMAETTSRVRREVEKLRAAEALATVVALKRPAFLVGRDAAREQAFVNLGLYWEHDWTADGPITRSARAAWQEKLADQIEQYVESLHHDAAAELGKLIQGDSSKQRFFAFNPLGWVRSDVVDIEYRGPSEIHVVDLASDKIVAHQLETPEDGKTRLRILANEIPAVGYKAFEIRSGAKPLMESVAKVSRGRILEVETSTLKLGIEDDGAIASLIDRTRPDVELAARIDGLSLNDLAANEAGRGKAIVEHHGPVSITLKAVSDATRNHTTRITLTRNSNRVDIDNEITEGFGDVKHWAFSFNLERPVVHTEELGAVIDVRRKSDGGDYADRHARYDYATLNHFADITTGTGSHGVTLSNADCSFVKLGKSTPNMLDTQTAQLNVLAGGQVDGDELGIRNQNGATYFRHRFALIPHAAFNQTAAMKSSMEHQNPLVAGWISGNADAHYPATSHSCFSCDHEDLLLYALKPHEDGLQRGVVVRIWNQSNRTLTANLSLMGDVKSARRLSHLETPLDPLDVRDGRVSVVIPPKRIQSLLMTTGE